MTLYHSDFRGIGLNATLELAERITSRDQEILPDEPIDFAGLARLARNPQTRSNHGAAQNHRTRSTQPIPCPEPNIG